MKKANEFIKKNYKKLIFVVILLLVNYLSFKKINFEKGNVFTEKYYFLIMIFFLGVEIALGVLINFFIKKNIKKEKIFLYLAIPIGLLYLLFIPLGRIPDERNHFLRAYEIAEGHLISNKSTTGLGGRELPKSADEIFKSSNEHMKYEDEFTNMLLKQEEREFFAFTNMSLYSFLCYIPQVIGILIGKFLSLPTFFVAYLGRVTNFTCWLTLLYFSIKIIPFKKIAMITIAFMPMMLQEAASLSADALTNGIAIFLISYVFSIKYSRKPKIEKKDFLILSIASIFMSLCKIVYLPICLSVFLIPKEKFKSTKDKYKKIVLLAAFVIFINLIWLGISSTYLIEFRTGVNSIEQVKFILHYPILYLRIFYNTLYEYITLYLFNIIGFSLCYFDVNLSYIYILMYLILLVIVGLVDNTSKIISTDKILLVFIVLSTIILMFTSLYVQWTSVGAEYIDGIQGRYFIPLLLPLALICNIKNIKTEKMMKNFEWITYHLIVFMNIYTSMVLYFNHI